MKRRNFLRAASSTAAALPFLLNGMSVQTMGRSALFNGMNTDNDRVLVLIQLNGGNDGLNMVLPLDQYGALAQVRSNILLPENSLLNLTDSLAVHPKMAALPNLFSDGKMGLVQSVGYPNQNRSHFRSTDIWTSGSPAEEFWDDGWLGRYLDSLYDDYPNGYPNESHPHPFAITMGSNISETCQGMSTNYSLSLSDPFSLTPLLEGEGGALPDTPYGDELSFLRTAIAQSNAYGEVITEVANQGNTMATYPEGNKLAEQLRNVALLISGGLKTSIYVVTLGGFDTHAAQVLEGDTTEGEHAELLKELSEAIAAFQQDLSALDLEERVLSLTFSEFGRRIRSNGSAGTDHGTAAPLLLFGPCVNPQILGHNPEIDPEVGNSEGVPMQYDFRDIYGSVLIDWFEVEEDVVRNLLYQDFTHLPIIQGCTVSSTEDDPLVAAIDVNVYPNPCSDYLNIVFTSENENIRLDVYDAIGTRVKTICNKRLAAGEHRLKADLAGLAKGVYFIYMQKGSQVKSKRFLKI